MSILSLQYIVNDFLRIRDYPFQSLAFLSYPKYKNKVPYFMVETNMKRTVDYIFFEHRSYIDTTTNRPTIKPSLEDPVFILTFKNDTCSLKCLPYSSLNSVIYKPKFKESTKNTVIAAIQIAKELNIENIGIEDNTYVIGKDNNCIPYSDLYSLFLGKTWYQTFLPIKSEFIDKTTSWYEIKDILQNKVKMEFINAKDEVKIGSAHTVLKQIAKNKENYIVIKNSIDQIFTAMGIKSQYSKIFSIKI